MRKLVKLIAPVAAASALLLSCGCSRAPLIDVDGSFMPSWMICLLGGILAAGLIQWQLLRRKIQPRVTPVVFYPSLVVGVACLLWLMFF